MGKYHTTLNGAEFFFLNHKALNLGHLSNDEYSFKKRMQSLGQVCIFLQFIPIKLNIFLASYIRSRSTLSFGNIAFKRVGNSMKLLLDHPFLAFKLQRQHCQQYCEFSTTVIQWYACITCQSIQHLKTISKILLDHVCHVFRFVPLICHVFSQCTIHTTLQIMFNLIVYLFARSCLKCIAFINSIID